jgi:hypothetical protein
MNTFKEDIDMTAEYDDERIKEWALQRARELNLESYMKEINKETCSCEERVSATEFFLLGPADQGCECETC